MNYPTSSDHSTFSGYPTTSSGYPSFTDYPRFSDYCPICFQQAMTSVEHSVPFSEATLLPDLDDHREESDTCLAPLFQFTRLSVCEHWKDDDFIDPRSIPTRFRVPTEQSSPPFFAEETYPLLTSSMWSDTISGDIGPSMLSYPFLSASEHPVCGALQASQNNVLAEGNNSMCCCEPEHQISHIRPSITVAEPSGEQAIPTRSYPDHFVPQIIYQPQWEGDRERYVSKAKLQPPVVFLTHDSPERGIPILQLLSKQLIRLTEGNEPAFTSCGPSISIRINWPGYQPFHKQVPTKDYTRKRGRITKEKLAKNVARCVAQCIEIMSKQEMQTESDPRWRVGPSHIWVEDIILVSLQHVSQGSWQPQLRLRPSAEA